MVDKKQTFEFREELLVRAVKEAARIFHGINRGLINFELIEEHINEEERELQIKLGHNEGWIGSVLTTLWPEFQLYFINWIGQYLSQLDKYNLTPDERIKINDFLLNQNTYPVDTIFSTEDIARLHGAKPGESKIPLADEELIEIYGKNEVTSDDIYDNFYLRFSNGILWPFLHRRDAKHDIYTPDKDYKDIFWHCYEEMNHIFANKFIELIEMRIQAENELNKLASSSNETTKAIAKKMINDAGIDLTTDLIWIHDYQLTLASQYIKEKYENARVGFFLHTPFPPAEEALKIPHIREIIIGMLNADLVGFHTNEYLQNFLETCAKLNIEELETSTPIIQKNNNDHLLIISRDKNEKNDSETLELPEPEHIVRVGVFPIGTNYNLYAEIDDDYHTKEIQNATEFPGRGHRTFLSMGRADLSKGLLEKLHGFEEYLDELLANEQIPTPEETISIIFQAIPSRTKLDVYNQHFKDIQQMIEKVNNHPIFARFHEKYPEHQWTFIHPYYKGFISPKEVARLHQSADFFIETGTRDGMCLVVKEWLASQNNSTEEAIKLFVNAARDFRQQQQQITSKEITLNEYDHDAYLEAIKLYAPECEQEIIDFLHDTNNFKQAVAYFINKHSQDIKVGALILSKYIGAAEQLSEGILVNPYDTSSIKNGIKTALAMPIEKRIAQMIKLQKNVREQDANFWTYRFRTALTEITEPNVKLSLSAALGSPESRRASAGSSQCPTPYSITPRGPNPFSVFTTKTVRRKIKSLEEKGNRVTTQQTVTTPTETNCPLFQGLELVTTLGDDTHSLYAAVTTCLAYENIQQLRNVIADKLSSDVERYRQIIFLPEGRTLEQYIEDIRNSNESTSDLDVNQLTTILEQPIIILGPDATIINQQTVEAFPDKAPIFVYLDNKNYDPLILNTDRTADDILANLIQLNADPQFVL